MRLVRESDRRDLIALGGGPGEFLMPRGSEPDVWVAFEKPGSAFIGWFILHTTEPSVAELGYRLRRECWGRGLATEGCRALLAIGFDEFGLERIVASTMAVNIASRRVMEKIGMKHVRTIHAAWANPLPGSEQGDVEYEITRKEWQERHSPSP